MSGTECRNVRVMGESYDGEYLEYESGRLDYEGEGQKCDGEKPRMDLLPFDALEKVAEVLTFGARKYAANNWQKVKHAESRYTAALLRHLVAAQRGEKTDPESGLSHAAHMATNALFILWFEIQKEKNMIKYNDTLFDYNSEQQKSEDIQRIGNVIFNKNSNAADQKVWLRFKAYVKNLENESGLK